MCAERVRSILSDAKGMAMDRRTFLKASGGVLAHGLMAGTSRVFAQGSESADLIFLNGAILTMDEKLPLVSAMAIKGQRIVGVGSLESLNKYRGRATEMVDLQGKGVSPGLIDAHSHLVAFGHMQLRFVILRPPEVNDFASLRLKLAQAASRKPEGEWIVGRGFKDFKEGHYPRRRDLDDATPKHPVLIIDWGGQFGVANTMALKKAGLLSATTKDPYGGKYLRDKNGVPDGLLVHYPAIYSVHKPVAGEIEQEQFAAWASGQFLENGVTCVHDNFSTVETAKTYWKMDHAGVLSMRVLVYPYLWNIEHTQRVVGGMQRTQGRMARLQGFKLAVDGFAMMYQVPANQEHLNIPMHPQDKFREMISTIHRADYQVDVHAVGDKGVDWTLDAFSRAAGGDSRVRDRRHRIEHFPFRKIDSIKRAAAMGVPVCVQPTSIVVRADDFLERRGSLPDNRTQVETLIPCNSFLKEHVPLAFGADVPAFPTHLPLDSIRCAMERKTVRGRFLDPSEAISFQECLRVHTMGGAWAAFDEGELGSLQPGKLADFVVWNKDLQQIKTAGDLDTLQATSTYVGGKKVFARA
jgi:predicted amidohydrolase YtcJ